MTIQAGDNNDMTEVANVCGQANIRINPRISAIRVSKLQLLFISGSMDVVRGYRGFNITLRVSEATDLVGKERCQKNLFTKHVELKHLQD